MTPDSEMSLGFFCDVTKSGCCLEQLTVCPSGQSSISHCTDNSLCPAGIIIPLTALEQSLSTTT